jgi:hypothetical protein
MYVRHIPEERAGVPGAGRLGRHVRHDPRSLAYLVPAQSTGTLKSVRHTRNIPVLDQGNLGSCTGNATEGALGTSPFFEAIPTTVLGRPTGNAQVDEDQAIALYSAATVLDSYGGSYPPTDTGSDGLSVAKAAKAAGLISGYRHATSLDAALAALAAQPVITGVNWYDSFDSPAASGLITIAKKASVRGGHEFVLDELDVENRRVWFTNSWGGGWGLLGRACIGWDDFGRLLSEQGDVTAFVPLSQPAPTPTPDPGNGDLAGCLGTIISAAQKALDIVKGKTP